MRKIIAVLALLAGVAVLAGPATAEPATADLAEHGAWLEANPAIADAMANPVGLERPAHTPGQSTIDVCRYIEALRFGLNPNGIQYRNCWEVHWWGQHQVVVRYISASTGNYFCVAYDRRGYDGDGEAFGFNDGCPYIGSVGFDSF